MLLPVSRLTTAFPLKEPVVDDKTVASAVKKVAMEAEMTALADRVAKRMAEAMASDVNWPATTARIAANPEKVLEKVERMTASSEIVAVTPDRWMASAVNDEDALRITTASEISDPA
jgi:hypothetical protein